jgi:putative protease
MLKSLVLKKGMDVYLNSNEGKDREYQRGWQSREHQKRIPLKFIVQGMNREPLLVKAIDPEGREVYAQSANGLVQATGRPLTLEFVKDELNSLGTTIYSMDTFDCFLDENVYLYHKELKDLRRELVEKMNEVRITRPVKVVLEPELKEVSAVSAKKAKLNVLLRTREQVESFSDSFSELASLRHELGTVILDFEFGKDFGPSVLMIKELGVEVAIATTRILKPQEYYNLKIIIRAAPDKILVRNLGALEYLKRETTIPLIGDFSFNVTNAYSLDYLTSKGLKTINVSYDLNLEQLVSLVENGHPEKIEITLHQYMPEFHMEHCVFAAFLSKGHSFKDCGKPCEKHEVKLKDPYGNWHHLKADQECRNTFFKATPQSASFLVEKLKERNVGAFRLEALNESGAEVMKKIVTYLKLLKGAMTSQESVKELSLLESYGLGAGQILSKDSYKDRKKEESRSL